MTAHDQGLELNVHGEPLELCCIDPVTGFYRNGYCLTGDHDVGSHVVCARVTKEFLEFSKSRGNDLTRAIPEYGFTGLKDGDRWCLCGSRWLEAYHAGVAPPIFLKSTHQRMLEFVSLDTLRHLALEDA